MWTLLREGWKHPKVSKVLNIVVGRSLGGISRYGQHVLQTHRGYIFPVASSWRAHRHTPDIYCYLEDFCLTWVGVCVLFSSGLGVMLVLPLGPHLTGTTLELSSTLTAFPGHIWRQSAYQFNNLNKQTASYKTAVLFPFLISYFCIVLTRKCLVKKVRMRLGFIKY